MPGGGGSLFWKRVPTAVRPLRSVGCRDPRWLKKGGCPLIILYNRGAVRVFASITIVCIHICSWNLSKQLFGKIFSCNTENSPLNTDFKGLFLEIHEKGAENLEMAKPGAVLCQKRGAVVSQLVPKLKKSVPPTPHPHPRGGVYSI